jgi:hypothetical protein
MSKVEAVGAMYEGQNAIIKARLTSDVGTRLSTDGSAVPTSVTIKVFDKQDTPATVLNATTTLAVATAFTTDATGYLTTGWTLDSTGYNFLAVIPDGDGLGLNVPWEGGHTYRIEVSVASSITINPGTQNEGPVTFAVELKVHSMLGVT